MTAVDRLAALEQAHAAATPGPWREGALPYVYAEGPGSPVVAEEVGSADAAAIVAEHNATPLLIAALRAVLDLADELEVPAGEWSPLNGLSGRIRSAIDAALGVDSGQQT